MTATILQYPPAFGYETAFCNAAGFYKNHITDDCDKGLNILHGIIFGLPPNRDQVRNTVNMMMYDPRSSPERAAEIRIWLPYIVYINTLNKITAYIPILSTVVGFFRLYGIYYVPGKALPNKYHHVLRGVIEALSLGFLLLIPDLLITLYRYNCVTPQIYAY